MADESREQLTAQLAELREKLVGNPSLEELERMQLHTDLLEKALSPDVDFHHHDTSEHHDHVTLARFEVRDEKS